MDGCGSPVLQFESQIEQRLADYEHEEVAYFLERTLDRLQYAGVVDEGVASLGSGG